MTRHDPKILTASSSDSSGGAARASMRILQALRDIGVDNSMLVKEKLSDKDYVIPIDAYTPHNSLYRAYAWGENKVLNALQRRRWNRYPDREQYFMSDLRGMRLHGALRRTDYDILHLQWINQRFIPLDSLPTDRPVVWTLHDSWPFCGICHFFFECTRYQEQCGCCPMLHSESPEDLSHRIWKKKRQALQQLDLHIVAPSNWMGDCARKSSLLEHRPVTVIPNCVDTHDYRPMHSDKTAPRWHRLRADTNGKKIVLFGAVNATRDKNKGFPQLLAALRILKERGNTEDMALVVFGATKSSLSTDIPVHYVGYLNDTYETASLYNLADLVVVPSLNENLSCVIMESLSCATPIVAFDIGGNADMVDHKGNGYLAGKEDIAGLADGILWCLENNADNRLGNAGRQKVLQRFAPPVVARQYQQLYWSICRQKNTAPPAES